MAQITCNSLYSSIANCHNLPDPYSWLQRRDHTQSTVKRKLRNSESVRLPWSSAETDPPHYRTCIGRRAYAYYDKTESWAPSWDKV